MIKKHEKIIKFVLNKHPDTKDNDQKLTSFIWFYDLGREKVEKMSAWDLLTKFSRDELPNPTSIRRCRKKIQEHNPEYRGEKWEIRQRHTGKVKKELKEWNGELF